VNAFTDVVQVATVESIDADVELTLLVDKVDLVPALTIEHQVVSNCSFFCKIAMVSHAGQVDYIINILSISLMHFW
jgi:hypothetical protein